MVQAGEASDVLGRDLGCILLQDEGIGVGRVGHNQHLQETERFGLLECLNINHFLDLCMQWL